MKKLGKQFIEYMNLNRLFKETDYTTATTGRPPARRARPRVGNGPSHPAWHCPCASILMYLPD